MRLSDNFEEVGRTMTLFWHQTGPLVRYVKGTLFVSDLNPEVRASWRMGRMEMLRFGLRCIVAAVRP